MGGLSGHMTHPHENLDLRIGDYKKMMHDALTGKLGFVEKIDGFNFHFLVHNGEFRIARSGADLTGNGIAYDEIDERFAHNLKAADMYKTALRILNDNVRPDLFLDWNGDSTTYNCEIIVPGTTNIVAYKREMIVIHNRWHWSINFHTERFVNDRVDAINAGDRDFIDMRSITAAGIKVDYRADRAGDSVITGIMNDINTEFEETGFTDTDTLRDYYRKRFIGILVANYAMIPNRQVIHSLFNRAFHDGQQTNLRDIRLACHNHAKRLNWFLDNTVDIVNMAKARLNEFTLQAGTVILNNCTNYLNSIDHNEYVAAAGLQTNLRDYPITGENMILWQRNCEGRIFGLEGVVTECNGQLYKWVGPFQLINKALGVRFKTTKK